MNVDRECLNIIDYVRIGQSFIPIFPINEHKAPSEKSTS